MTYPPGPRGREVLPFFHNAGRGGTIQFLADTARRYGPISYFRILNQRVYLLDDADLIQEVLVTRQHSFVRDTGATLLRELVGDGLLTRDEPAHKHRRRILQPAFHRAAIASYAAQMVAEADRFSNSLRENEPIDLNRAMKDLTLAIVGACLFGADFRGSAARVALVLSRVMRCMTWAAPLSAVVEPLLLAYRQLSPRAPSLLFFRERRELERIVNPIIAARRAEGRSDMLSLLLAARDEDGSALSTDDLRNELITFVLAGHETTATTLTWTWYLLAQHPQIEAKIHAEVDRLGDRPLGPDDVHHLPYTEMVLREAMRLYPAALAFGRRPAETLELGGYTIPKGATIFLIPYVTHRNPYYFDRPECFDPERWQNWAGPKGAYFPFGAGSKMCIGEGFARLEALLILATVVRRWRLTFFEHAQEPPPIVLQAAKPIRLTPVRRESRADPLACARLGDRFTAR